ncbi:MAG: arylsulfatase [Planctomycetota bacterium]
MIDLYFHGVRLLRNTLLIGCAALAAVAGVVSAQAQDRPNIVVLMADDLGWADVGFNGTEIATPHIDALAERGVRLTRFYVQPTCSPTRAALMTGRHPYRSGAHICVLRSWHKHGISLDERFLPEMLSDAGYTTAMVGKWHLGLARRAYWPTNRGFDSFYGHLGGGIDYYTHEGYGSHDWQDQEQTLREEGYATHLIGNRATELIEQHDFDDAPLFLFVAFNAPHTPLQAEPEDLETYAHIPNQKRRTFAAMVHSMDQQIGRIVATLEAQGLSDDTLVIFTSDNGGPTNSGADNGPWRGGKGTLFEGGVRVPTVMVWPDRLAAGQRVSEPMHIIDFFPTFAVLTGGDTAGGLPLDGRDVGPALWGGNKLTPRNLFLNVKDGRGRGAVISGHWKLIVEYANNQKLSDGIPLPDEKVKAALFDLEADPYETTNLAESHPGKVQELWGMLKQRGKEVGDAAPYCQKKPENWQAPADWSQVPE